jgi:hypothetical protein
MIYKSQISHCIWQEAMPEQYRGNVVMGGEYQIYIIFEQIKEATA